MIQGRVSGNLDVSLPSDSGHAILSHLLFPFVSICELLMEGVILYSVSRSEGWQINPQTFLNRHFHIFSPHLTFTSREGLFILINGSPCLQNKDDIAKQQVAKLTDEQP